MADTQHAIGSDVLVNAGALQMVRNALKRDADEGKQSRREMLAELEATIRPVRDAPQAGEALTLGQARILIDYRALIEAAWGQHRYAQGTSGCIAFKRGAEWAVQRYASQPMSPLTDAQVAALLDELNTPCVESESPSEMFAVIVRAVERVHGVGSSKKEEMLPLRCAANGNLAPGAMCGHVIVGSKKCGAEPGSCEHQRGGV